MNKWKDTEFRSIETILAERIDRVEQRCDAIMEEICTTDKIAENQQKQLDRLERQIRDK